MRRFIVLALLALSLASACSETETPGFDVAIIAEQTTGNAPLTVTLRARDNGPLDHLYAWRWRFDDGQESAEQAPTHRFEAPGRYAVRLEVTDLDTGVRAEATLDIEALPPADLAVDEINFSPTQTRGGQPLNINWRLENKGAAVMGGWRLVAFVSRDGILDEADPQVELRRADDPAGARETLEAQIPLPEGLESGDYLVGVVADPEGLIGDADPDNNLAFAALRLEARDPSDVGPNLTLCGLALPAFDGVPLGETPTIARGEQLDAAVCLGNTGNRPVIGAGFSLYLSEDATLDPGDLLVGQRGEIALGVGDRLEFEEVVDLPFDLAPGAYRLIALADPLDAIAEQIEDDNLRAWPDPFNVVEPDAVEGVDLALRGLRVEGDGAYWGQTLRGEVVLENRGQTPVERLFVLRLLAQPLSAGEATQLRSENLSGLGAGETLTLPLALPITRRVEAGEYRLSAVVDPSNSARDVNLANNTRTLQDVLLLGGEPDLDPAVVEIDFEPAIVEAGAALNVQGRVRNLGLDESGPLDAVFFLSADDVFDEDDVILERLPLDPISGGGSVPLQRAVTVPVDLDRQIPHFWVGLAVDPEDRLVGERDEENNHLIALEPLRV
ncbi:PKD domain-containing protein, partial [Myxococcota bacterium]|nr:PKD domain-containing protein [Myxococcota bacterium]